MWGCKRARGRARESEKVGRKLREGGDDDDGGGGVGDGGGLMVGGVGV